MEYVFSVGLILGSGMLGAVMQKVFGVTAPQPFWLLGVVTGVIVMAITR